MVKVFSQDWIEYLQKRYNRPGIYAPPVYRVATADKWKPIRDEIEEWFSLLDSSSQKKILINLRNPKSFIQSYNELTVAGFLLQFGYELEYETVLEGLTPDWLVKGKTEFIVEVFSRKVSSKEESRQAQISELWERLRTIPIGVGILLRYENIQEIPDLNSGLIKKIATEVRFWLEKEQPKSKTDRTFYGINFEILNYNSKWTKVVLAGPSSGGFVVNNEPLREGIEEKVRKYKRLTDNLKLPLIVAVVPSFETALDFDDFEEVLFDKGLFLNRSILSAVIGLQRNAEYQSAIFYNPSAKYPLSENSLKI